MRSRTKSAIVVSGLALFLVLATGCVTNQPQTDLGSQLPTGIATVQPEGTKQHLAAQPKAEVKPEARPGLSTKGQTIVDHKVVSSNSVMNTVEFSTDKSIPGKLWAVIPDAVLSGQVPIASIYWHGDDENKRFKDNPPRLVNEAWRVRVDAIPIAVYRPHSTNKYEWRSLDEIRLHLALVEYLSQTFGVSQFNLYGHSSGGLLAVAVAQERPRLAATVGLAAPVLAVKRRSLQLGGGISPQEYKQYDPIDHIQKLLPEIPVLIVYDLRDRTVKPGGVIPYVKKADQLGLNVKLVEVQVSGPLHHYAVWKLGSAIRASENQAFHPLR